MSTGKQKTARDKFAKASKAASKKYNTPGNKKSFQSLLKEELSGGKKVAKKPRTVARVVVVKRV